MVRSFYIPAMISFLFRSLSYVLQLLGLKDFSILLDYYGIGMLIAGLVAGVMFLNRVSFMPNYVQAWRTGALPCIAGGVPLDILVIVLFGGYPVFILITAFLGATFGGAGSMGALFVYRRNNKVRNAFSNKRG